ncbi:MAG: SRPBCC family protein, partial [Myxococcota bacterium]
MIKLVSHKFADIPAPADDVWEVVADFGSIEQCWPAGLLSRIEIEGAGIGMVRALHTMIGIVLRERLDALYPDEHRIELSIFGDLPVGITAYTAAGAVIAKGTNACRIDWIGRYQVPNKSAERAAREFVEGAYMTMFRGIRDYVSKNARCAGGRQP